MKKVFWSFVLAGLIVARAGAVSLNTRGQVAHGVGASGAYVDGTTLSTAGAGGTAWVDDNTVIYQVCDGGTATGCRLETYDTRTTARATVDQLGANSIAAGGGVWAKWLANYGVFTSAGFACPTCGLIAVGPDGSFAYKPSYQSNGPFVVRERDGAEWKFSDVPAYDVELLGGRRIIWTSSQTVFTMGIAKPLTASARVWRPRVAFLGSEAWVVYWTEDKGLVAHPFADNTRGYILRTTPDAFSHDMVAIGPRTLRIAFATNEAETPGSIIVRDINVDTDARVDLLVTAPPPPPPPPPPHGPTFQNQAPEFRSVIADVIKSHPEINVCDEDSLDKGRAAITDWTAQRLNKRAEYTVSKPWGRKSRGKPNGTQAVNPNTDGLTFLRTDGRFEIIDAIVGGSCKENWENNGSFAQGENGYWAPPQLPAEGAVAPPPPDDPKLAELQKKLDTANAALAQALADRDNSRQRVSELEAERDQLTQERDDARQKLAEQLAKPQPSCEAKVPSNLRRLGIKIGCRIVTP